MSIIRRPRAVEHIREECNKLRDLACEVIDLLGSRGFSGCRNYDGMGFALVQEFILQLREPGEDVGVVHKYLMS